MKKLKWAEQKLRQVNFNYDQMKKFGFRPIEIGGYNHMIVHQKKRIIIKQAGLCTKEPPCEKYIVPTLFIDAYSEHDQFQIQPFCNTNKKRIYKNLDAFQEKVDPNFEKGYDIHGLL